MAKVEAKEKGYTPSSTTKLITAIAHEKTLVTRNVRDFQWIEGLRLYNPIND